MDLIASSATVSDVRIGSLPPQTAWAEIGKEDDNYVTALCAEAGLMGVVYFSAGKHGYRTDKANAETYYNDLVLYLEAFAEADAAIPHLLPVGEIGKLRILPKLR